jgi:hypothetical protein
MWDNAAPRPLDPQAWAYRKILHGQEVNPLAMVGLVRRFVRFNEANLLAQVCEQTGKIAVSSRLLPKRTRERYRAYRITAYSKSTYYLFDRSYLPADVAPHLDYDEATFVYTGED